MRSDRSRREKLFARTAAAELLPLARRRRLARIVLIAIASALVCAYLDQYTRVFDYAEQKAYGERLKIYTLRNGALAERAWNQIVLVEINDDTVDSSKPQHLSRSALEQRDCHAAVIRVLTRAGARVIAFDFLFKQPALGDAALADAARASGRVVWGGVAKALDGKEFLLPNAVLLRASPHVGQTNLPNDSERPLVDRLFPVLPNDSSGLPAFSLEVARMALGLEGKRLEQTARGWRLGSLEVPVTADGTFPIRYLGSHGTVFSSVSYETIYRGADPEIDFRNKIVLIGDTTTAHKDFHATPLGTMWGLEINANAVATLLQQGFLSELPPWGESVLLFAAAALVCLLANLRRLRWAAISLALLPTAYLFGNIWLFADHDLVLPLAAPCVVYVLAGLGSLAERGLTEEREKYRMRALLRRHVSPQIADCIVDRPERYVLGGAGERVTATVLFSDIRDFTALSVCLAPEQVVALLNEYFQAMTDVIFRHDGATARFAGDSIMALFGVPVPHLDHARRAVAAAIDMQAALLILQSEWQARGLPAVEIGIGINTGEMVAGTVGALQRTDFTVYGPPVNIAARVESLNKVFGTRILITDATLTCLSDSVAVRGPMTAQVKGVEDALSVYEVLGWRVP